MRLVESAISPIHQCKTIFFFIVDYFVAMRFVAGVFKGSVAYQFCNIIVFLMYNRICFGVFVGRVINGVAQQSYFLRNPS